MSEPTGTDRPHLRVVSPATPVDREALMAAVEACVTGRPGGMPPAELVPAIAEHLALRPEAISDGDLDVAMGILVVMGRIDETAGLLVAAAASGSSAATG